MTQSSMAALPFLRDEGGARVSVTACGIRLDFSRQRFKAKDLTGLYAMAEEKGMLQAFRDMVAGKNVNVSEGCAALHTSLRSSSSDAPMAAEIRKGRKRMLDFARQVREGIWRGCRGERITDVINVGIGGSEKGPHAVYHALRAANPKIRVHFLSSVDGVLLERILDNCNPLTTLAVISSKSFSTRETPLNATAVDQWFFNAGIVGANRERHMVVVSANPDAVHQMCLPEENFFPLWKWVGGRFSVWGSVGLPVAIALGPETFSELLQGAEEMDRHTMTAPIESNLPAQLALFAYWNATKLCMASHCLLPYDERLRALVPWLQQLEMESLGKTHDTEGRPIEGPTGLGVWGANGNEGQHSFYQWLREGTSDTSIDIIWSEMPGHRYTSHYQVLLANARAQAEALVMRGSDNGHFNAVTAIIVDAITPRRLGAIMAMYEHKTTMLGTLFGINPFDQPGVELGKRLSHRAERGMDPTQTVMEEIAR